MQFLVDPGEEGDGRVGESEADCRGLGALFHVVPETLVVEPLSSSNAVLLFLSKRNVRCFYVWLEIFFAGGNEIDMRCETMVWIHDPDQPSNVEALVSALRNCASSVD